MPRVGRSKAWPIACLVTVINFILLVSCQAPAPVQGFKIKTASEDDSSGGGLVPKDVAYSVGASEPFNLSVSPPFHDFHITDYPGPNGCVTCLTSLSANLKWSPPSGFSSSEGVGLGTDLGPDNIRGYGFGITVLKTETNSSGEKIATSIFVDFHFTAVTPDGIYPSKGRSAHLRAVFFSLDGKNFSLDLALQPAAGMYMSYEDRIPDAPGCSKSAGGGTSAVIVTSAKLVLDSKAETATLDAAFSGSVNDIYWDYKAWNPDYPDSKSCWFSYFGGPASAQIQAVLKTEFLHQIKCQKSYNDSSPFYYDNIDDTPIEFAVDQENHTCSLCNVDQIRNPDKNNSKTCVDACIPGHRTSNHGYDGCPPIPTPTPPLNCPICPPGGPSSGPGGDPGNGGGGHEDGGDGDGGDGDGDNEGGPSSEPPGATPSPTSPTGPSPSPSGGGSDDCSEPGHQKVKVKGKQDEICIYCPADYFKYNEDPSVGCYTILNFKIEQEPEPSASPAIFSPRDANGQFDKLNFVTKNAYNIQSADHIKWDMFVVAETGPLRGKSNLDWSPNLKGNKGVKSIPFDGRTTNQSCLIDGKYRLEFSPKSESPTGKSGFYLIEVPGYHEPVEARLIINPSFVGDTLHEKKEMDFWVDNTPPILKDLVVSDASQPDQKSIISFTIKDPIVNDVAGGLAPQMFVSGNNHWLIIDLDEHSLIPEESFMIASILPSNYYRITRINDTTATVRIEVSGLVSQHIMEISVVDRFENLSKYLFFLKNGVNN